MSRARPKWRQVSRYLKRNNYVVVGDGGDKIVIAPAQGGAARTRNTVRIGHKCCSKPGNEVWPCYTNALNRAFGISLDDLLNS